MNKQKQLLRKINFALLTLGLTQCQLRKNEDVAYIQETKHLHQFHIVKKGESLEDIAKKYNMPIDDLKHINQIDPSFNKLHRGQRIHVHKKDFDKYPMIPQIQEKPNAKEFNDYNVLRARSEASHQHYVMNKPKYDKLVKYALLPVTGLALLGAGAFKTLKSVPKLKSAETSIPSVSTLSPRSYASHHDRDIDGREDLPDSMPSPPQSHHHEPQHVAMNNLDGTEFPPPKQAAKELLKIGASVLGGVGGLGFLGINKMIEASKKRQTEIKDQMHHGDSCARIAMGWPLNHQKRRFRYVNPEHKEAGIYIENTQRELFVVPAFPGQIIDVLKPDKNRNRYTIFIKHKCNNLVTIYGNIRIPSEEKAEPIHLIGVYVSKADAIGLIDPDHCLFFGVKQIQAGRHAERINYDFQKVSKHVARLIRYDHDEKVDVGGMTFGVKSNGINRKIILMGNKEVSEVFFVDPLIYLPKTPVSQDGPVSDEAS